MSLKSSQEENQVRFLMRMWGLGSTLPLLSEFLLWRFQGHFSPALRHLALFALFDFVNGLLYFAHRQTRVATPAMVFGPLLIVSHAVLTTGIGNSLTCLLLALPLLTGLVSGIIGLGISSAISLGVLATAAWLNPTSTPPSPLDYLMHIGATLLGVGHVTWLYLQRIGQYEKELRHSYEKELERSCLAAAALAGNQAMSTMVENMIEGIVVQERSGKIVRFNQAACRILGITPAQMEGRDSFDPRWRAVREDLTEFPGAEHPSMVALATGKPQCGILMGIEHPTGELHWIRINAVPTFRQGESEAAESIATFEDITEQRQLEIKLAESTKLSSLGEMAAGVAHEINNPLTIIKGNAAMLRRHLKVVLPNSTEAFTRLETIENTVTRTSKIVMGLKNFAREGSQDPFLSVPIHQLVEEALSFSSERFRNHSVELQVDLPNADTCVDCRSGQIIQVLLNLLQNAFDAVNEKAGAKWIRLETMDRGERVRFMITDCGNGIPTALQKKILQPFFTTKPVGKGTGLGLSISLGIIRAHQGEFFLDTSCQNTRFVIDLWKKQPVASTEKLAA